MFKKTEPAPDAFRDVAEAEDVIDVKKDIGSKKKGKNKKPPKATLVPIKGIGAAASGHNSGLVPAAVELVNEILDYDEKIKELGKAKRDIRNRLKNEFGVLAAVQNYEISMRKKDQDVRIQIESGIRDFKTMLGYNAALDFKEGTVAKTEEEFADPSNKVPTDRIAREG